jgi:hypothetical protein
LSFPDEKPVVLVFAKSFMFKRYILAFAAILSVFAAVAVAQQKKKKNAPEVKKPVAVKKITFIEDKDEYAVYRAVLREKFQNKTGRTIVLNKEVTGCATIIDRETERLFSRDTLEQLFTDCSAKKWGNFELHSNHFQPEERIILVSENELGKIFIPTCDSGWRKFYRKYPNAAGNASFSRIGFDSGRNFAVVNFGSQSGCSEGGGEIVFLQKEDDAWRVKKSQATWVS